MVSGGPKRVPYFERTKGNCAEMGGGRKSPGKECPTIGYAKRLGVLSARTLLPVGQGGTSAS